MTADRGTSRAGDALASLVCLGMLVTGFTLTAAADRPPLSVDVPGVVLPLALLAAFVFTSRVSLDFEVRGDTHSVTLGQLPLALGALFVDPWLHLAACLGVAVLTAAQRRHRPLQLAYNSGAAALEVGAVTFAVHLAGESATPTLALWLLLLAGLSVSDAANSLALSAVWRLVGVPVSPSQVVQPLALGGVTTIGACGTAVVVVSAAYTEPASLAIALVMAGLLAYAYRRYTQLRQQQATTADLYAFVRDLGPVDVEHEDVLDVLEQVRVLLHAEELELVVAGRSTSWHKLVAREHALPRREQGEAPTRPRNDDVALEVMTTTLLDAQGLAGVLTARGRLGQVRAFDLGDQRMLETVGGELATALERGSLLADLQRTATTDALTGLPNLAETSRRLDELLAHNDGRVVLASLTVDTFREVNETLGHGLGDALLLEVTRRLRAAVPHALVGRTGGARFAVAVPAAGDEGQMLGLRLRGDLEGPARLGPVGTLVKLSVGVAEAPEAGTDAQTLLRRAETAMSSAREAHGGPVAWAPAYEVRGQRRLAVVSALSEAVRSGGIGLAFQPKLDVQTGSVVGVEALARWTDPALGAVRPDEFVPLAEASGFIGPLTTSVLRQAATACRGWQRRAPGVGVAVNVSADTVLDPAFVGEVGDVLAQVGLAPELLTVELTEGVLVSDPALAVERLAELRARGVRVAVDDFGTGYSSLAYLKGLPVDEVKIDKSFVSGLASDRADEAVVRAAVDIAHALGLTVVAEGVEDDRQGRACRLLGVDAVQGYLYARPMAAGALTGWLRQPRGADARH